MNLFEIAPGVCMRGRQNIGRVTIKPLGAKYVFPAVSSFRVAGAMSPDRSLPLCWQRLQERPVVFHQGTPRPGDRRLPSA